MKIAIGSDHGGFRLKAEVVAHLLGLGHDVEDVGTHDGTSCDYPDVAQVACARLSAGGVDRVILVCGTGQGMAIAANKHPQIRAAVVSDTFSAAMASAHNDAAVLCLGERVVGTGLALACVDAWLGTAFEGGRHARRVEKIEAPAR
ncbi:MAG: ribose 5-phosphate isomerase [Pseudomonadota bacterium]|jgi:ribose 5-phosphate isomerase B